MNLLCKIGWHSWLPTVSTGYENPPESGADLFLPFLFLRSLFGLQTEVGIRTCYKCGKQQKMTHDKEKGWRKY